MHRTSSRPLAAPTGSEVTLPGDPSSNQMDLNDTVRHGGGGGSISLHKALTSKDDL